MKVRWLNIGPWMVGWRNPILFGRRPPKVWICINDNCDDAHSKMRRLSASGSCRLCGQSMRKVA